MTMGDFLNNLLVIMLLLAGMTCIVVPAGFAISNGPWWVGLAGMGQTVLVFLAMVVLCAAIVQEK